MTFGGRGVESKPTFYIAKDTFLAHNMTLEEGERGVNP